MRQVSIAKRGGNGSVLLPKGVSSVEDLPADLASALSHAYLILSWQENLPEDEIPPRWMWHLDWELERHFEEVEIARRQKYGTASDDGELEGPNVLVNDDPEIKRRFGR